MTITSYSWIRLNNRHSKGIPWPLPRDSYDLAKLFGDFSKERADKLYNLARGHAYDPNVIEIQELYTRINSLIKNHQSLNKSGLNTKILLL